MRNCRNLAGPETIGTAAGVSVDTREVICLSKADRPFVSLTQFWGIMAVLSNEAPLKLGPLRSAKKLSRIALEQFEIARHCGHSGPKRIDARFGQSKHGL
jgi:hypothetical protein